MNGIGTWATVRFARVVSEAPSSLVSEAPSSLEEVLTGMSTQNQIFGDKIGS